jgi:hypothetical protein
MGQSGILKVSVLSRAAGCEVGKKLLLSDCETVQRETVQQVVLGRLDESVQVMFLLAQTRKLCR